MSSSTNSVAGGNNILSPFEAESYINSLRTFDLVDIGTDPWMTQHERIEKLNIQAHISAISKHDEYVVDAFATSDKVSPYTSLLRILISYVKV